jgi:hypothetical protein
MNSMRTRLFAKLCGGVTLISVLSAAAQSAPIPLSTYTNPGTGVSFQYPSVWRVVPRPAAMTPPSLIDKGLQPLVDVEFSPKGNLYEKTNLVGLNFLYFKVPAKSVEACYQIGEADSGDVHTQVVTLNGVTYQHSSGGGAATCHEISYGVYATFRDGQCHLFEQDFMTFCAGVVDGTRGLTAKESNALQHHLDAIMQSVTFHPPHD